MLKVGIIVGSTRPGRKAEAVARWVHEIARKRTDADFEHFTAILAGENHSGTKLKSVPLDRASRGTGPHDRLRARFVGTRGR